MSVLAKDHIASGVRRSESRSVVMDVYRALACGMVLVYHLNNSTPIGLGQAGMELFFVLSGYLISKSLMESVEREGVRGALWFTVRRFRRLMPAMIGFLVAAYFLNRGLPEVTEKRFAGASIASLLGYYNFYETYFMPPVTGMRGVWSLSLEEQFYAICFISIIFLRSISIRSTTWLLLLALSLLGVGFFSRIGAFMGLYIPRSGAHLSYLPPLRLWGFGVGVLIFYSKHRFMLDDRISEVSANWIVAGCLVIGGYAISTVSAYNPKAFMYQWCLIPVLVGAMILVAQKTDKLIMRVQGMIEDLPFMYRTCATYAGRFVRLVGLASYSIYLWQSIVIAMFYRYGLVGRWYLWVSMLVLSLVSGLLSWRYVEKRFYLFSRTAL